jgi:TonB family protein
MKWIVLGLSLFIFGPALAVDAALPKPILAVVPDVSSDSAGTAEVGLLIDQLGRVTKAVVIRSDYKKGVLRNVLTAARDWRFVPARRGCVSVPSSLAVQFSFDPNQKPAWSAALVAAFADPDNKMPTWSTESAEIKNGAAALERERQLQADHQSDDGKAAHCVAKRERISYPMGALGANADGVAMVLARVAADGGVLQAEAVQSFPRADFGVASAAAVKQFRFNVNDSRPTAGAWICVPFSFRIQNQYDIRPSDETGACDTSAAPAAKGL